MAFVPIRVRLLLGLLLVFSGLCWPSILLSAESPKAVQGEIDLRNWSAENVISLDGEWHFFWNELLSPEEAVARLKSAAYKPNFVKVGTRFRESSPDAPQNDSGYASYVLVLRHLSTSSLSLRATSAYTNSKLFMFSTEDAKNAQAWVTTGQVGMSRAAASPSQAMTGIANLTLEAGQEHVLLIQVSNFHFSWGGLWVTPRIGNFKAVLAESFKIQATTYFVIGTLVILFVYNFSFFLRRPADKASLYLSIFVALSLIRSYALANWSNDLMGNSSNSFEFSMKIIFLTITCNAIAFQAFLQACFPKQSPRWLLKLWLAIFAIPYAIILFFPGTIYGVMSNGLKFSAVFMLMTIIFIIIRAAIAREEGAIISLLGALFLMLGAALDIAYTLGLKGVPTNSAGIGLVVFAVFQSQIIAVRFARAFRESERLSRTLAEEVERQTREIKSILKNIRQGIFTLVYPFKQSGEQFSDYLQKILGRSDVQGQTIDQLLLAQSDLSSDAKSQVEAAIDASLGEDSLGFELNEDSFVREMRYRRPGSEDLQIFEIDWSPIVNSRSEVEKLLVSIRDVTEEQKFRAEAEQREEDMKIVVELIQIPEEKFQRFTAKANEYLKENRDLVMNSGAPRSELLKRLFMNMHTIKGAARTYFLKAISTAAHDVEQYYSSLQKDEEDWDSAKILSGIDGASSTK